MKPWLLLLGVALLGTAIYLLVQGTSTASPPMEARASAPPPSRRSLAPSPSPAARAEPTPSAPSAELAPAPLRAAPTTEPLPSPSSAEIHQHLEEIFRAEPLAAPSRDLTASFEKRLRDAIPTGASLRKLECHRSLCRIETSHPSLDDFGTFVRSTYYGPDPAGVLNGPFHASLVDDTAAGQPVIAVAFFGREGTLLPMPGALPTPPERAEQQR